MLAKRTPGHHGTSTATMPDASPPATYRVVYERPRPRIAKGVFVLLLAGPLGLLIFAMGQTVWGALWRGWLGTAILLFAISVLAG